MTSTGEELIQLIVCSDDRALELAKLLCCIGRVYRRRERGEKWSFSLFDSGGWKKADDSTVPQTFDVMFFHKGQNDPSGIPKDRTFDKEFAFSTDSVATSPPPAGRKDAIAIQRPFPPGGCPIKQRHLPELKDFVRGTRKELPSFCLHEAVPVLSSLAILCQGYAAAGIAHGDIPADGSFATALGWDRLETDSISRLSGRLADIWPDMKNMDWWRASLGISNDAGKAASITKYRALLARLIQDLELDVLARNKLKLQVEADLAQQPEGYLLDFLGKHPDASDIAALLKAWRAEIEVVEKAFKQVKRFLEQR